MMKIRTTVTVAALAAAAIGISAGSALAATNGAFVAQDHGGNVLTSSQIMTAGGEVYSRGIAYHVTSASGYSFKVWPLLPASDNGTAVPFSW